MRETFVQEADEAYLGPVAMAQFVDCGWIRHWPMCWSPGGRKAVENGFGRWDGVEQKLPAATGLSPHGAAFWDGRRAATKIGRSRS